MVFFPEGKQKFDLFFVQYGNSVSDTLEMRPCRISFELGEFFELWFDTLGRFSVFDLVGDVIFEPLDLRLECLDSRERLFA
jgi:hypothetical protein